MSALNLVRVFQIYFHPDQLNRLEPEYIPYFNNDCSLFMENTVMVDLVNEGMHEGADYFGVVAYKLREKLGFTKENWKNNKNIANTSTQEFTPKEFERQLLAGNPDVMSFQRHSPHDTISVANGFHPGFRDSWIRLMNGIGYGWAPTRYEDVFYCNYFVARPDVYERFVKELLSPAIDFMALEMKDLLTTPCPYPHPLPEHLQKKWNRKFYTFHPFLCERLFTHFAHVNKLKCLHY